MTPLFCFLFVCCCSRVLNILISGVWTSARFVMLISLAGNSYNWDGIAARRSLTALTALRTLDLSCNASDFFFLGTYFEHNCCFL